MTVSGESSWRSVVSRAGARRRALDFVLLLIVPTVATLLAMRFLIPSRLEGARGGVAGFAAWLGDQHPLFLGVALFVALSETTRYWLGRSRPGAGGAAAPAVARGWQPRRSLILGLAVVALAAFAVRGSVLAMFRIVGPSMLPTLEIGDRVLVNRLAYGFAPPFAKTHYLAKVPKLGDLVVFHANGLTGAGGPASVVKRVVGVPGDHVAYINDSLQINGWRVPTCDAGPYVDLAGPLTVRGRLTVEYLGDQTYLTIRRPMEPNFDGYRVQPGEVFVVGDDRGQSSDSRAWNEGNGAGVPIDILQGRVTRVVAGARPDGRLDFSRIWQKPFGLHVRMPGIDMSKTEERIQKCLARRPAVTTPPPPK
jgi:signal peptidase I